MRSRSMPWNIVVPGLFVLLGLAVVGVAMFADLVGLGDGTIGVRQWATALVGLSVFIAGLLLLTPGGQHYLRDWRSLFAKESPEAGFVLVAAWFGMLTGLGQMLWWFVRKFVNYRKLFMGDDFIWMAPLANLVLLLLLGLLLAGLHRLWPRLISRRVGIFFLATLALFNFSLLIPKLYDWARAVLSAGLAYQIAHLAVKYPHGFNRLARYMMGWTAIFGKLRRPVPASNASPSSQSRRRSPSRRDFLVSTGSSLAALAVGVRGRSALREWQAVASISPTRGKLPNVLFVVLDTVRAKSLSLHGYERPTSPNVDRLARAGVTFERAISTSPWTLPSHGSMFTGRHPHELGVGWVRPIRPDLPLLTEVLAAHGYEAGGFAGNLVYCSSEFGLSRGFHHYEDYRISPGQLLLSTTFGREILRRASVGKVLWGGQLLNRVRAEQVNDAFLAWLSRRGRRPFFGFLNYFDAHEPYLPPAGFRHVFTDRAPRGHFNPLQDVVSAAVIRELNDAYDQCIVYVDAAVGTLLDELGRRAVLDDTLVIITADHGEQFGEHDLMLHGNSQYMPLLHVPLVLSHPDLTPAGGRVAGYASLRNLPATIFDLVGIPKPQEFPGQSLRRAWDQSATAADAEGMLLSELERAWAFPAWYPGMQGPMKSVISEGMHFIKNYGTGREELYDLGSDPEEVQDLIDSPAVEPIRDQLRAFIDQIRRRGRVQPTPEEQQETPPTM